VVFLSCYAYFHFRDFSHEIALRNDINDIIVSQVYGDNEVTKCFPNSLFLNPGACKKCQC
jgi:hypothetical protein